MTTIKDRVLQVSDYKGVGKEKFFEELEVSYGTFKGKAKESGLNSNILEKIIAKIPEISAEWLLTGKGEMLKSSVQNIVQNSGKNSINNISGNIKQQNYNELMEIIREKDRQIAKKDEQINKLIEKLIN